MQKATVLIFFCITATLLWPGCSVQKRRYQNGFYIAHKGKTNVHSPDNCTPERNSGLLVRTIGADAVHSAAPYASAEGKAPPFLPKKEKIVFGNPGDSCDVVLMRNGEEVRVRVVEVATSEIKYKQCSMPDGPLFVVRKRDIFRIRYQSGREEVFPEEIYIAPDPAVSLNTAPQRHPHTTTVVVLAILGWFPGIGSIPAIIVGNKALKQIRAQPDRYTGAESIRLAVIFSWIKVALLVLYLASISFLIFSQII